jgi:GTP 3',8-cyclase
MHLAIDSPMPLQDRHGRQFRYLRLSITDVCNFRCNYCLPDGYQKGEAVGSLSLDEIDWLVRGFAAVGIRKVRITGGEPSVRSDLSQILERIAAVPGIETMAMTSNGYRLNQKVEEWQRAGLNQINISIDSLDPRTFHKVTGHNCLPDLLAGINKALALGMMVKVNVVLLRGFNLADVQSFIDWVKDRNVAVRFIELMRTGENQVFFSEHHVSGEVIASQLLGNGWKPRPSNLLDGPAREYVHPDYSGRIGLIMPYSRDFCSSCNRLRISAQGKLHLCLFGEEGHDVRQWLSKEYHSELPRQLQALLGMKEASHYLHEGISGQTRNFAMLGG